jgi:retinol dehydrogenase-12
VLDRGEALPLLVNNAGLAGARGLTKDGFEIAFGTNHLGPYLFTRLLVPVLEKAGGARVVNVSSTTHYKAKGIDWDLVKTSTPSTTGMGEYEVSKLATILFTSELAKHVAPSVHTYSLHPGVVSSDVWREVPWGLRHLIKLFMLSAEDGAKTSLYCATSDAVASDTGKYYDKCKEKTPSKVARDEGLAKELWERSAAWVDLPA